MTWTKDSHSVPAVLVGGPKDGARLEIMDTMDRVMCPELGDIEISTDQAFFGGAVIPYLLHVYRRITPAAFGAPAVFEYERTDKR